MKKQRRQAQITKRTKRLRDVLAIDIPPEIASVLDAITKEHPFTRTRLGLHALMLGLPELQRRYPPAAKGEQLKTSGTGRSEIVEA